MNEQALIALGSNLGDSPMILREAMNRLETFSAGPLVRSSIWKTAPLDCPPGTPFFFNAGVVLRPRPKETPESLLDKLLALEVDFGRPAQRARNQSRTLDLDLIAFGRRTGATGRLILPHPRAHQRRFVLGPLAEIAPEFVLVGVGRTLRELAAEWEGKQR